MRFDPTDAFTAVDDSALAHDIALSDPYSEEGSDLAFEGDDIASLDGLEAYQRQVMRRLMTALGSLETYAHDPSGLVALDGSFGSGHYRTVAEPSSGRLFETISRELQKALATDPSVATFQVSYAVDAAGKVIFDVTHAPVGGASYTDRFQFTDSGLMHI